MIDNKAKKKKGGAPVGNKYAVGNKGGAPAKYDPLIVAEQLNGFIDAEKDPMIQKFTLDRDKPSDSNLYTMPVRYPRLSHARIAVRRHTIYNTK